MREWTREEKYRYLKDPQEVKELYYSRIYENIMKQVTLPTKVDFNRYENKFMAVLYGT